MSNFSTRFFKIFICCKVLRQWSSFGNNCHILFDSKFRNPNHIAIISVLLLLHIYSYYYFSIFYLVITLLTKTLRYKFSRTNVFHFPYNYMTQKDLVHLKVTWLLKLSSVYCIPLFYYTHSAIGHLILRANRKRLLAEPWNSWKP